MPEDEPNEQRTKNVSAPEAIRTKRHFADIASREPGLAAGAGEFQRDVGA